MNVRRLAEVVAAAGHQIDLVTSTLGADVPLPPRVRVVRAPAPPFVRGVPIGPSFRKIAVDVPIFVRAASLLRREPAYDLLHGFEEGAWIAAALGRAFGVGFVYDMDSDVEEQTAASRHPVFRALRPLVSWIDGASVRSSTAVLTVCRSLTDRVRRIAPQKPVFQIEDAPNVIEPRPRDAARQELRRRFGLPDVPLVVYTGNLEPYQGVDLLVRAAARVVAAERDVAFVIAGGEPAQVRTLERLAQAVGAGERVVFVGARPESEMTTFLGGADVLVSPRVCGSNTPLKLYAYLLSGNPVVATDRPVHAQVVSAEEAMLAPPTPEGMASAILALLRDPGRRAVLGANGRRLVETQYSPAAFAERTRAFLAAIETLANARRRAA